MQINSQLYVNYQHPKPLCLLSYARLAGNMAVKLRRNKGTDSFASKAAIIMHCKKVNKF
jgi:hypothetical protein